MVLQLFENLERKHPLADDPKSAALEQPIYAAVPAFEVLPASFRLVSLQEFVSMKEYEPNT